MATGGVGAGYPCAIFPDGDINKEHICNICKNVLMDPVQGPCGHRFCDMCFKISISSNGSPVECPSCQDEEGDKIVLTEKEFFLDKAIKREMYKLRVVCPDCQWAGSFAELDQEHWRVCPQKPAWAETKATTLYMLPKPKLPEADVEPRSDAGVKPRSKAGVEPKSDAGVEPRSDAGVKPRSNAGVEPRSDAGVELKRDGGDMEAALVFQVDEIMTVTNGHSIKLDNVDKFLEKLRKYITSLEQEIHNQHASTVANSLGYTSYDGVYLWKIGDYAKKKQLAIQDSEIKLVSPKFYTSPYGYNLRACVYLNGDGMGKQTHLSVFLVLCKGDYDLLLPWPFARKTTVQLVNPNGEPNLVDTFTPRSHQSAFKRPTLDQNIPAGFPKFAPQKIVEQKFLSEDTLFLLFQVDTHGLKDPVQVMKT